MGLNEQDIRNQLKAALYGQVAATFPQQDRLTDIRVRYPDAVRFNLDRLERLPIALPPTPTASRNNSPEGSSAAAFVILNQVATIEEERSPNEFWRENQQPMITVTGELGGDEDAGDETTPAEPAADLGSVERKLLAGLASLKMPGGYRWELAGNFRSQQESFASLLRVLIFASALVFLLLGFQFRSLALPLLIFLSQPVSLASARVRCGSPARR